MYLIFPSEPAILTFLQEHSTNNLTSHFKLDQERIFQAAARAFANKCIFRPTLRSKVLLLIYNRMDEKQKIESWNFVLLINDLTCDLTACALKHRVKKCCL